jgi:hypothetical protein
VDEDGIRGLPRSTDVPSLMAWIVGFASMILVGVNFYQRDWTSAIGPALTAVGMLCLIIGQRVDRKQKR